MNRVRTIQLQCLAMLCIGVASLSAQQQRHDDEQAVMAAVLTLHDSAQAVLGKLGGGNTTIAFYIDPSVTSLGIGSEPPVRRAKEANRLRAHLTRANIPTAAVSVFRNCPGVLAPDMKDASCPPAGFVVGFIGNMTFAGDSAIVPVSWVASVGQSKSALSAELTMRKSPSCWRLVRVSDGQIIH